MPPFSPENNGQKSPTPLFSTLPFILSLCCPILTCFFFIFCHCQLRSRTTLSFWAGHRSSEVRVQLASAWENDRELDIQNNQIDDRSKGFLLYQMKFYRARFCICPGSSQVNSGRIADSIHYGCVPDPEALRVEFTSNQIRCIHMIMYELWLRRHVIKY